MRKAFKRIAHHLDFASRLCDLGELVSIGQLMLDEAHYYLSPAARVEFSDYVARQMLEPRFANARSVRNDLDRARLRHAHRLAADAARQWTRDELMRLEPEDILEEGSELTIGSAAGSAAISADR